MPPQRKFTKSEIVGAAYEIARESGIDAVVARAVGRRLGSSPSPIFALFRSMDELKQEVRTLAKRRYRDYMTDVFDYTPAFKEFGMRWVRFALDEPNLYRLLFFAPEPDKNFFSQFQSDFREMTERLEAEVMTEFELKQADAEELLKQMIIFANGMTAFSIADSAAFSREEVSRLLSRTCVALVIACRLRDGTMDAASAGAMANAGALGTPIRKKSGQ